MLNTILLLSKISIEGFEQAAQYNTLFGVLVSIIFVLVSVIVILFKLYEAKNKELKSYQEVFGKTISTIRKEHADKIDEIRKEIIAKEDERNRQWRESERETLNVLNGVNSVLGMSEKMKENDTKQIIDKIGNLEKKIEDLKK